jgi:hypothetical protein
MSGKGQTRVLRVFPLYVRLGHANGLPIGTVRGRSCATMYGPAVRCKTEFQDRRT